MECVKDFEDYAEKHLDDTTWTYYAQGAERELTLKENLRSYTRCVECVPFCVRRDKNSIVHKIERALTYQTKLYNSKSGNIVRTFCLRVVVVQGCRLEVTQFVIC